jgi:hypothetical protein
MCAVGNIVIYVNKNWNLLSTVPDANKSACNGALLTIKKHLTVTTNILAYTLFVYHLL